MYIYIYIHGIYIYIYSFFLLSKLLPSENRPQLERQMRDMRKTTFFECPALCVPIGGRFGRTECHALQISELNDHLIHVKNLINSHTRGSRFLDLGQTTRSHHELHHAISFVAWWPNTECQSHRPSY